MADRLTITPREGLGIASVMARKSVDPNSVGAALGMDMPRGPYAIFAGGRTVLGTSPSTWLVFAEEAGPDFADTLAQSLTGLASISEQSSGYVVHRLAGLPARVLLQRGVAIDLHPESFSTGAVAMTVIAHIGMILWQVDDHPTYDVAVARSYAGSFRYWLEQTAVAL